MRTRTDGTDHVDGCDGRHGERQLPIEPLHAAQQGREVARDYQKT
jgi:hypothetical protein